MAGKVADEILINIQVQKSQADREVRNWQNQFNNSMSSIDSKMAQTENQIRSSTGAIGGHLRSLAGVLAAGFSVKAVNDMAGAWTDMTGRVRLAVDASMDAEDAMQRISSMAVRTYSGLEQTAEAFLLNSNTLKELGYSTNETLDYVESLNNALVVSGAKAQRAESVMNALSKAMADGKLAGDNLNTVIQTGGRVSQLIADRLGVTTLELRKLGKEGKITGQVLYEALAGNLEQLRAEADSMKATVNDAFQNLRTRIMEYIGTADESLGATERMAAAITMLSNNLDKVGPVLGVLAAVIGGKFLAGILGTTAASLRQEIAFQRSGGAALVAAGSIDRLTASTARFATAGEIAAVQAAFAAGQMTRMQIAAQAAGAVMARTGSSILAAFGGPVGLAVAGVSFALMGLAKEAMDSSAAVGNLEDAIESADSTIAKYNPIADKAADAANSIGNEATVAVPKIDAFAGAVGRAAQQLWELAKAKQAAALAELRTERETVSRQVAAQELRTPEGVRREMSQSPRSIGGMFGTLSRGVVGGVKDIWTGGESTRQLYESVAEGRAALTRLDAAIADASQDLEQFAAPDAPRVTRVGGGDAASTKKTGGRGEADRAKKERERAAREALQRQRGMEDDLFRVGDALLSALMERQLTAEERLDLDLQALQRDRDANTRSIDRSVIDGDRTLAEGEILKALEEGVYNERVANRKRQGQQAIRDEQLGAEQALLDLNLELLQISAGSARTAAESRRVQLEILRLQQDRARKELERRISDDPSLDGPELRRRLGLVEQAQTASVVQRTQDPLEAWFESTLQSADAVREAYQKVAADGLESISNGIVDIVTGAKTAKEAFRDMAMSIIQDISKIAAKQFVASLFGGGENSGGGGSAGSVFSTLMKFLPGRANGGIFNGAGSGTSDSNVVRISDGEFVTRARQTKKYRALLEAINQDRVPGFARGGVVGSVGSAGSLPTQTGGKLIQQFFVDAKGSIMAEQLMDEMQSMSASQAANAGFVSVSYTQARAQRGAVRNRQRFV